jgi:hypothetical protein
VRDCGARCTPHCESITDGRPHDWTRISIGNRSIAETFADWFLDPAKASIASVDQCSWPTCNTCNPPALLFGDNFNQSDPTPDPAKWLGVRGGEAVIRHNRLRLLSTGASDVSLSAMMSQRFGVLEAKLLAVAGGWLRWMVASGASTGSQDVLIALTPGPNASTTTIRCAIVNHSAKGIPPPPAVSAQLVVPVGGWHVVRVESRAESMVFLVDGMSDAGPLTQWHAASGGNALVPGYDDDINSHLPALEDKLTVVLGAASGRTVSAEYVHLWS